MLKKILNAKVYDILQDTPLDFAPSLSQLTQNQIYLKREDLQSVFSFKIRGAYNCIAQLSKEAQSNGILAASAGNHAQGVAFSAQKLGLKATIIMPKTTPLIKVNAVKNWGAEVILVGDNYSEAADFCTEYQSKTGMTYVHPFDDLNVIAGQATVAQEILKQLSGPIDIIFVPVGGGGLIAGILSYVKEVRPEIKIIGVEPFDSNAMTLSLAKGELITLEQVGIFADGVAVKKVGKQTFALCQNKVDDMVLVDTDEICSAIKSIYQDTRSIMEPAGALAVAGMKKYLQQKKLINQTIVAINSGANMNFERLSFIAERTRIGEKQEALYAIQIPEKPGALRFFCNEVLQDRNLTEFNYRLADLKKAQIFVGLETITFEDKASFEGELAKNEFPYTDITENNLAKSHVRYMIGSRSTKIKEEVLYHFWFPERKGALAHFLQVMDLRWNITLFHYRSRGGDFGQVLIGLDTSNEDSFQVLASFNSLGYPFTEETDNIAYQIFLKGH